MLKTATSDEPLDVPKIEDGVRAAKISVTLHPVPEGKAKTTRLSKEEFKRRIGKNQRARRTVQL